MVKINLLLGFLLGLWLTATSPSTPFMFPNMSHFPNMLTHLHNPTTEEGFELGRYLFYDTILSINNSVSCGSCHQQQFAFADNEPLSKGIYQQKTQRNTMPLYNLRWSKYFFWDGRVLGLENQIFEPVRHSQEMGLDWNLAAARVANNPFYKLQFANVFPKQPIDSLRIVYAIAQFLTGLVSATSKYDSVILRQAAFSSTEYEGYELVNDMTKGNCMLCHVTDGNALGTNFDFSNNGLDSTNNQGDFLDNGLALVTHQKKDKGRFKTPSLRNIFFTAPYMHDGRFKTIAEVLNFYSEKITYNPFIDNKIANPHQGGQRLTTQEKEKIIDFLKTMTDWSFQQNPRFANPYKKGK